MIYKVNFSSTCGNYHFVGTYETGSKESAVERTVRDTFARRDLLAEIADYNHFGVPIIAVYKGETLKEDGEKIEVWDFIAIQKYESIDEMVRPLNEDEYMQYIGAPSLLGQGEGT